MRYLNQASDKNYLYKNFEEIIFRMIFSLEEFSDILDTNKHESITYCWLKPEGIYQNSKNS